MKHPVYWLLLSSGLVASTYASFAAVDEKTLTSADSYDGNTTTTEFVTQENTEAGGTNYTCTGDICIAFAGKTTPLAKSCFGQTTGDLSFTGTGGSLCFDNVNATGKPAAIEVTTASKNLSVTGFSLFSCISCPPGTTGNGAISSKGTTSFDNDAKILFNKNCSSAAGGAISCAGLNLTGTTISATFTNNTSTDNGGAIGSTGANTIQNNTGKLLFSTNSATKAGGAIHSDSATTISNNASVVFSENSATGATDGQGGAIYGSKTATAVDLKLEGNKELIFKNNTSGTGGGAIYTDKLTITSGGPTLFTNNSVSTATTPKGGAISLADSNGECSLTAELGDIVFEGNTVVTTGGTPSTKRNAIDLGTSGKFMQLRAGEGRGIYFYDPIANNGDTTTEIVLNKTEGTTTFTGSIVFSGEKLSADEKTAAENLSSFFKQPLKVGGGSLVLKDGVILEAKQVSQEAGSAVVMDVGTTLQTPSANGETITLENLEINVASLGGGGVSAPAKITAATTDKNVTISAIKLVESDGNTYENPVFSTTKDFASTLEVTTNGSGTITLPTDPTTGFLPATHYGYQGNWSVTWAQGTVTTNQNATLDWKQTGYNPNPERQGPLVPNTLWGAFSDIRSLQNLMEVSVNGSDFHRGFWVSGIGNFINKSGTPTKRKFRHTSAGYVLGLLAKTDSDDVFSAAFSQMFGRDKDYLVSKNTSDIYAGSIYYQHTSFWDAWDRFLQATIGAQAPLVFDAQLAYSHTSNDMKTNMTTRYTPQNVVVPEIKGEWGNDCFAVELGATVPIDSETSSLFDIYSPFLKFQLVYAHQEDFKENNSVNGRHFESSNLTNLSMPIGVKFERFSDDNNASYNLTLTYAPDIARNNPESATSLLVSPATALWTTKATNLARQAFIVRAGNHLSLSQNFEIFSQFGFELRGSSRNYNVDLGSKIQF
ncbi:autotransporter domain-containing protein [Chlamydia vaughanii]|uniref:autotransporter domain-containing protein n=1 Tax=Chlamydia vaughanii TaxID=3112552 RepID=UPI0032B295FB